MTKKAKRSNQKMEPTASGRIILPSVTSFNYPVAMRPLSLAPAHLGLVRRMEGVVEVAVVVFLLGLGGTRFWISRCLRFLTVEQKSLFLDSSSLNGSWFPFSLALFAAFMFWFPGWLSLPTYYVPGVLATYALTPLLLSVAVTLLALIRISRLGLPVSFTRRVCLGAIIYHVGLLFLICSVIYVFVTYARHRDQHRQTFNRAIELTTSRCLLSRVCMNSARQFAATRLVARGSSACSR